jgi:uncharacterized protein YkwD
MFIPFLLAMLSACTKGSVPANTVTPSTVNKTVLLQLVNDARKKGCQCGTTWYPSAPAVNWNDQLEKAAYQHSKDMSVNNYFSHDGKDGSDPGERMTKAGYNWKTYGENIGIGYNTEQEVVSNWLKSPGHCKNIMSASYKEIGAGKVGKYWTMNVGSR